MISLSFIYALLHSSSSPILYLDFSPLFLHLIFLTLEIYTFMLFFRKKMDWHMWSKRRVLDRGSLGNCRSNHICLYHDNRTLKRLSAWLLKPIQGRGGGGGHCIPPPPPPPVNFLKYLTIWKVLASQTFWLFLLSIFHYQNVCFRKTILQSVLTMETGFLLGGGRGEGGDFMPRPLPHGAKKMPALNRVKLRQLHSTIIIPDLIDSFNKIWW